MQKSDIFWQTYLNLEKELLDLSKYVFFTDEIIVNSKNGVVTQNCTTQLETFSPYIADLLVRCCVQIEAISKELYFDNGGTKPRGDNNLFFDEDCLKLLDIKWNTHSKIVIISAPFFNFTRDENKFLKPLKEAHKRQGTYWEKAYQAVKHDRYASLSKGNIKSLIHALAALYLLNLYYRNDSWITKHKDISSADYSMGSSVFSVKAPIFNMLWKGNNEPILSDSPYAVRYKEDEYRKIESILNKENEALNNYIMKQPELNEQDFQLQLQTAFEQEKKNPQNRVIVIWELAKYRLNKKLPNTLLFEDRKNLLIKSEEWNGRINQQNKHLSPDEITEDNIQKEIDSVGINWGMQLEMKFKNFEWVQSVLKNDVFEVYIPK